MFTTVYPTNKICIDAYNAPQALLWEEYQLVLKQKDSYDYCNVIRQWKATLQKSTLFSFGLSNTSVTTVVAICKCFALLIYALKKVHRLSIRYTQSLSYLWLSMIARLTSFKTFPHASALRTLSTYMYCDVFQWCVHKSETGESNPKYHSGQLAEQTAGTERHQDEQALSTWTRCFELTFKVLVVFAHSRRTNALATCQSILKEVCASYFKILLGSITQYKKVNYKHRDYLQRS